MAEAAAEVAADAEAEEINMKIESIPYLGSGIGFRNELSAEIFFHKAEIDFLEIIADHYMSASAGKKKELDILRKEFTCIPHGLDLSLGSADGIDEDYLNKLAEVIEIVNPPYWSEHISFTKAGGISIGHLSPLQRNKTTLASFCRNAEATLKKINKPLILENITCMIDPGSHEMDEPEFLNEITRITGCGLLMDVTNLFTNSQNYNFSAIEYLDRLDCSKVVQLHYTGVHFSQGKVIDAHGENTQPEIFDLMKEVVKRSNVKGIILERDENIPALKSLLGELKTARSILQSVHVS